MRKNPKEEEIFLSWAKKKIGAWYGFLQDPRKLLGPEKHEWLQTMATLRQEFCLDLVMGAFDDMSVEGVDYRAIAKRAQARAKYHMSQIP